MDHFIEIYTQKAALYHRMIAAEDVDNNLFRTLDHHFDLANKNILDLGSGTGRIPLLAHKPSKSIAALDLHWDMLVEQKRQRANQSGAWSILQADLIKLPIKNSVYDLVTSGWALGHFVSWYGAVWLDQVTLAIAEMGRVVKPGGFIVIIETLTTGSENPAPPTLGLAQYYKWLEAEMGFTKEIIRTDYQFADLQEAVELTGFFFGTDLTTKIKQNSWVRLPEWTGIWWLKTE